MSELQWHAWRKPGIGASEAPVVYLGRVFNSTRMSLYIKKVSTEPPQVNTDDNPNFRRGHMYEPLAATRFTEKTGIQAHYPADDAERYGPRYCLEDPDHPHRHASLDAICDDGWILEVKSPKQITCDKIRSEGLKDYYQVQAAYQAAIAQKVGTFAWGPGECKGVRLCIWEPENADTMVIELPYDEELSQLVVESVDDFWNEHVSKNEPPIDDPAPPFVKSKGGKYQHCSDPAFIEASQKFVVSKDAFEAAKMRLDMAKGQLVEMMDQANMDRIQLPSGIKFLRSEQEGRKSLDLEFLLHEHPNIDIERYQKKGHPFKTFRVYGVNKVERDGDDMELSGLSIELAQFVKEQHDPELLFEAFDDLRSRTEIYTRTLVNEAEALEQQLKHAAKVCKEKVFGGSL